MKALMAEWGNPFAAYCYDESQAVAKAYLAACTPAQLGILLCNSTQLLFDMNHIRTMITDKHDDSPLLPF
jgi:hypothetical protein